MMGTEYKVKVFTTTELFLWTWRVGGDMQMSVAHMHRQTEEYRTFGLFVAFFSNTTAFCYSTRLFSEHVVLVENVIMKRKGKCKNQNKIEKDKAGFV